MKNSKKRKKNYSAYKCHSNNFEVLMPMIAKYVEDHPEEYKKYLEEKEQRIKKQNSDKAIIIKK